MSLRDLANAEMVAVTKFWVDAASSSHRVLSTRRLTAAILPEVERAHAMVARLGAWVSTRLVDIQGEQGTTDIDHDSHVRGIYHRLLSEEELATDPAVAALYRDLRNLLFPEGLALVKRSYRYEAGHAVIVESRLSDEVRDALLRLPTHNGTLLTATLNYLQLGYRLGELDEERAQFNENLQPDRAENNQARSVWINAVSMMRMAAAMIGPEDVELAAVMALLDKAEAQAQRRRERARGGSEADGEEGEVDGEGGANDNDDVDVEDNADDIDVPGGAGSGSAPGEDEVIDL